MANISRKVGKYDNISNFIRLENVINSRLSEKSLNA